MDNINNTVGFVKGPTPTLGVASGVSFEGEITPEKQQLAKQFETVFQEVNAEFEDMFAIRHSDELVEFSKKYMTTALLNQIKKAATLSVFLIGDKFFIKTSDGKLEPVADYCFRLEKAVLNQIEMRKAAAREAGLANETIQIYRKKLEKYQAEHPIKIFFLKLAEKWDNLKNTIRSKNG